MTTAPTPTCVRAALLLIQSSPMGQHGPYRTETLDPPIKILKASRKQER